jgi:lipoprotein NlpI
MKGWPAPVVRLFLGEMTPAGVLTAADDPDPKKRREQVCEANFYSGEMALFRGAREEATRLFRIAASECPHTFVERSAAVAELKALGASP